MIASLVIGSSVILTPSACLTAFETAAPLDLEKSQQRPKVFQMDVLSVLYLKMEFHQIL